MVASRNLIDFPAGLGLQLMRHCIDLASSFSMEEIYLSTKNKMGFYSKLGFSDCSPVSILTKVNAMFRGKDLLGEGGPSPPGITWMRRELEVGSCGIAIC